MSQKHDDLGEQALSKLAEMTLASQLDEVEELDVNVNTDPIKLVQGQVDSATISGTGMVMKSDLRMEKMEMKTSEISINPLSVAFGQIELKHPTQATAEVVLTEADINRAFNSDYILKKLQGLEIAVEGNQNIIDTQAVEFKLPGDGRFFLQAYLISHPKGESSKIAFTALPEVSSDRKTIQLKDIQYSQGGNVSPELTQALIDESSELLNLDNFNLKGVNLRIQRLNLEPQKITLLAEADVESFPSAS
ncbi:LmeA family phospholipid-binding protein [Planktothrix sp. FACHB-1365]|uniref:LmeA family phospholipid-binding protein n=1 Tax=Planktothrix sp. FACHB-1365 TaxID=2692855 RepID=UPI00168247DD|nr:LmeA family phospholipid-binding protein [Planktothrix sp. FACHB-1365]MBD2482776.1 DUF2993 domain-containing protein [Planktothrix sp. FACHB-1365]